MVSGPRLISRLSPKMPFINTLAYINLIIQTPETEAASLGRSTTLNFPVLKCPIRVITSIPRNCYRNRLGIFYISAKVSLWCEHTSLIHFSCRQFRYSLRIIITSLDGILRNRLDSLKEQMFLRLSLRPTSKNSSFAGDHRNRNKKNW